jgi:DNA-binding beta-propeller fold protein YncE
MHVVSKAIDSDLRQVNLEVNTGDGTTIKLQLEPKATVLMVKQEIERMHGIEAMHAHLFVHGEEQQELGDLEELRSLPFQQANVLLVSLLVIQADAQQVVSGLSVEPEFVIGTGSRGSSTVQLSNPQGVAFVRARPAWLVITEYANQGEDQGGCVKVCDMETCGLVCKFGDGDGHTGQLFNGPVGVAVTADSTPLVFVANLRNHNVQVLQLHIDDGTDDSAHFTFVQRFGHGHLNGPTGLALLQDNGGQDTVLVTDAHNTRVSQFTFGGTFIRTFTTCDDYKYVGRAVNVLSSSEVAVCNSDCVQIFDCEGNYQREFGKGPGDDGKGDDGKGDDVEDGDGKGKNARLSAAHAGDGDMLVLGRMSTSSDLRSDGQLFYPVALASDVHGNVLVIDRTNRLQVLCKMCGCGCGCGYMSVCVGL